MSHSGKGNGGGGCNGRANSDGTCNCSNDSRGGRTGQNNSGGTRHGNNDGRSGRNGRATGSGSGRYGASDSRGGRNGNGQCRAATPIRCAIYTRKSTTEGLEQEFSTLDAQREAGEAYVASQKAEGWICLPERYDDGGFTGGNLERPAVQQLLADIEAGKIDCVVVYKVDRLSRSLLDFARMMEIFERQGVSFVSVTQQFNTTHSMGRLTLNILLSFAQFEREIISERTRDKIAAARRKGKWSGGPPVLGYDILRATGGSKLIVNAEEAECVRRIFEFYVDSGSLSLTLRRLAELGWATKSWTTKQGRERGGKPFNKSTLFNLLTNVVYRGQIAYRDQLYEGEHDAIVDEDLFHRVQRQLRSNRNSGGRRTRNKCGALLKGLVRCAACGSGMSHHFATHGNKRYRYYVCVNAQKRGWDQCPGPSLPAAQLEQFVIDQIRVLGQDDGVIADAVRLARSKMDPDAAKRTDDDELVGAVEAFDPLWEHLQPRERERLVHLLVRQVTYDARSESISVTFNPTGIAAFSHEEDTCRVAS